MSVDWEKQYRYIKKLHFDYVVEQQKYMKDCNKNFALMDKYIAELHVKLEYAKKEIKELKHALAVVFDPEIN